MFTLFELQVQHVAKIQIHPDRINQSIRATRADHDKNVGKD